MRFASGTPYGETKHRKCAMPGGLIKPYFSQSRMFDVHVSPHIASNKTLDPNIARTGNVIHNFWVSGGAPCGTNGAQTHWTKIP